MQKERELLKYWHVSESFRKSPFRYFVRAKGMEEIGILTKIEEENDVSWGIQRKVAYGFTWDGDKIEEYLDRKNQRTGEIESIIQIQTTMQLVTARNSDTPDDTDDNNFQYIMNPHQANEIKDQLDQMAEDKRISRALEKKAQEAVRMKDSYYRQLVTANSEAESLREKVSLFADKLGQARSQAEYYRTQNKKEQVKLLEMEGYLSEQLKGASSLGEMKGKDSADVILDRAKKEYKVKEEMTKLGLDEKAVTKEDFDRLENKIFPKIDKLPVSPPVKTESEEKRDINGQHQTV